jgi:hypothetical protein
MCGNEQNPVSFFSFREFSGVLGVRTLV